MTTNPLTADKNEADDEPMVMVSLNGNSDDDTAGPSPEAILGGDTSDSGSEEDTPTQQAHPAPRTELSTPPPLLSPAPSLPPSPTIGFQNLGVAIQIAVESSDAGGGSPGQKNKRAVELIRAMVEDAGPAPGTPSSEGIRAFVFSDALADVIGLVHRAAHGELQLHARSSKHPCLQSIFRCLTGVRKN